MKYNICLIAVFYLVLISCISGQNEVNRDCINNAIDYLKDFTQIQSCSQKQGYGIIYFKDSSGQSKYLNTHKDSLAIKLYSIEKNKGGLNRGLFECIDGFQLYKNAIKLEKGKSLIIYYRNTPNKIYNSMNTFDIDTTKIEYVKIQKDVILLRKGIHGNRFNLK